MGNRRLRSWFTINYEGQPKIYGKVMWTFVCHRICPIYRDNVFSPDNVSLVAGIRVGYDIDVAQLIFREICGQSVRTDTVLAFTCCLRHLCLGARVQEIPGVYQIF